MLRQARGVLLLAVCIGLSYQICWNHICPEDRCDLPGNGCPSCIKCDTNCGYCNPIDNCCKSHIDCVDYDGICDTQVNPTTCNYCDITAELCKKGCVDTNNCHDGDECINHRCEPIDIDTCHNDADCNVEHTPICDVGYNPYTNCFYCEGGKCKPGCMSAANCPSGYKCTDHKCIIPDGSTLIESITIKTKTGCTDCSREGVELTLYGKKNFGFPDGVPCSTDKLDHESPNDYDGHPPSVRFDGTIGGVVNDKEKAMMSGCYEAPLKGVLSGGTLVWKGAKDWEPLHVCVDWRDNKDAWLCTTKKTGDHSQKWNLDDCYGVPTYTKCNVLK